MYFFMILYVFVLFFLLTPGILVTLPPKGSTTIVALTHALAFTLLMWLTHKAVWSFTKTVSISPAGMMH